MRGVALVVFLGLIACATGDAATSAKASSELREWRTADGKPNFSAPAPRLPDGKPALSGTWEPSDNRYVGNIAAGMDRWSAVVEATCHRVRPILLTAAAAILAMIPIASEGFWGPMAFAIMGGLVVATVLTLLALPAMYAAWFRVKRHDPGEGAPAHG